MQNTAWASMSRRSESRHTPQWWTRSTRFLHCVQRANSRVCVRERVRNQIRNKSALKLFLQTSPMIKDSLRKRALFHFGRCGMRNLMGNLKCINSALVCKAFQAPLYPRVHTHTQIYTHTHTLSLSLSRSLSLSLSLSLSHTHTHTHTYTHTHTHSLSLSLSHSHAHTPTKNLLPATKLCCRVALCCLV